MASGLVTSMLEAHRAWTCSQATPASARASMTASSPICKADFPS